MHTCIHFCSPPSGVSGSAPAWEWINNTKVWLDVWDPDSGFHFPDREPGRCPFLGCLATFSRKAGTIKTEHPTPSSTRSDTNKRAESSVEGNWYWGGALRVSPSPRCCQSKAGGQHYVTVTGHWNMKLKPHAFLFKGLLCHLSATLWKVMLSKWHNFKQALILHRLYGNKTHSGDLWGTFRYLKWILRAHMITQLV